MYEFKEEIRDIYLLKAPFSSLWTGVVLVRGEKNFLIDSGADSPDVYIIPALKKLGLEITDIDYLLNTHCHGDHIGGHYELKTRYGLYTVGFEGGLSALTEPAKNAVRIRTKFPKNSPTPQSWLKGVEPDIVLSDGEVLCGRLKLIATPGHDSDCVCWLDIPTGTLITGDSIQGNGTLTQGIGFYQSLGDYRESLKKLLQLDCNNIIAGHEYDGIGDVILGKESVRRALEYCYSMTEEYGRRIREYLGEGLTEETEIAKRLISEIGVGMPEMLFLALYTVTNHITDLKENEK